MTEHIDNIAQALADIAAHKAVVVLADEGRDCEGDLVFAAEAATPALMAFAVRHTSGYLGVALPGNDCDRLDLPPMWSTVDDRLDAAFTVTVDAAQGVSTGISAADRAHTARTLADPTSTPADLTRPGHVLPLRASDGGVLRRPGRTEAAVDLVRGAGLLPAAALCGIVSPRHPTEMARRDELIAFAAEHGLSHVSLADLVAYRRRSERHVALASSGRLRTRCGTFVARRYTSLLDGAEHMALIVGDLTARGASENVSLAVHVECVAGEVFGSTVCRCAEHLDAALTRIATAGRGVVVYWRPPPGQLDGSCSLRATRRPSFTGRHFLPPYAVAAAILADLGTGPVQLVTGSAEAVRTLEDWGATVEAAELLKAIS